MWKKPGNPVPIEAAQVAKGVYVWLNVKWTEHPFLSDRFLVETEKDVAILQTLDLVGRLFYYPDMSTAPLRAAPPVARMGSSPSTAPSSQEQTALNTEVLALEKAKKDKLRVQKDAAARAERAWDAAASATREALVGLSRSPKSAGEDLAKLSRQTAATITQGQDILLHLLGDRKGQGPQFHALNTRTLCMLLGKVSGLNEKDLSDLALAALAHDCGKSEIPLSILKISKRKKFEEDFYRQHVPFSVKLAAQSGAFSKEALATIADHHEAVDGSGWPQGKKDAAHSARILSVVDRYEELCSPQATDCDPLMPAEALSFMYRNEASRFDPALLSALIKLLGVYPPGTLVQLSNGALALVVSPGPTSLLPKVLLYSPEVAKEEAPTLELSTEPGVKITEAIRPSTLPSDVLEWLNPQQRLSYYFSVPSDAA